jgi:tetratricopeptide (TPR) repeat protein
MNRSLHFSLLFLLTSCAAALVPETNDPKEKIQQAYTLMGQGRSLAAEKLMKQAQDMFRKKGETSEVGRSYLALGDLYKSGKTHGDLKLPDYRKSADSYAQAAKVYLSINWAMTESMALWFAGGLYIDSGDKKLGCSYLAKALSAFKLNSKDKSQFKNPESMPIRVRDEMKKNNC